MENIRSRSQASFAERPGLGLCSGCGYLGGNSLDLAVICLPIHICCLCRPAQCFVQICTCGIESHHLHCLIRRLLFVKSSTAARKGDVRIAWICIDWAGWSHIGQACHHEPCSVCQPGLSTQTLLSLRGLGKPATRWQGFQQAAFVLVSM